jgi:integrase
VLSSVLIDGRRRSVVTLPEYRRGMKPPNAGRTFPAETYTRDEMDAILIAFGRGAAGDRNRAATVIQWRCGLRINEALDLFPKDVNLAAGTVTVLAGKGGKRRVVGIDRQTAAEVEIWLRRRAMLGISSRRPLFCVISRPTLGKRMYNSVFREALKDAGARAGVGGTEHGECWGKRVHPHGLRHSFASDWAREGRSLVTLQYLLGHADLRTTQRYIHRLGDWEAIDAARDRTWPAGSEPAFLLAAGAADLSVAAAQQLGELPKRPRPLSPARALVPRVAIPGLPAQNGARAAARLKREVDLAVEPVRGVARMNLAIEQLAVAL